MAGKLLRMSVAGADFVVDALDAKMLVVGDFFRTLVVDAGFVVALDTRMLATGNLLMLVVSEMMGLSVASADFMAEFFFKNAERLEGFTREVHRDGAEHGDCRDFNCEWE